jgi:hypothetical protein
MYLRVTTVRRGSKTYRYAQLVESYRREDGTPTNRVLVSLGRLNEAEIAAIRAVLDIARKGGTPVLPAQVIPQVKVLHSLRYLDAAMLLRAWRDFGLQDLLTDALGPNEAEVCMVDVVAALVLQRCLAPASKLAASRWYPTTALPELQGVVPEQFNNSRVHRALASLEAAEARLQDMLPDHIAREQGAASILFLDATDTWFVGQGPPLAAKGKDKQGLFRQRVGIVMLCDGRGFPMRWHTLDGRFHDPTALGDMAAEVAQLPWAAEVPVVIDRALGHAGWVEKLDKLGLRYVTCVPASELESCGAPIPWKVLDDMQGCGDDLKVLRKKATKADFLHVHDDRYILELGIFNKSRPRNAERISRALLALRIVQEIEDSTEPRTVLAQRLQISIRNLYGYKKLTALNPQVRERIRSGDADALSITQLQKIAALPAERQIEELEALVTAVSTQRLQAPRSRVDEPPPLRVRGALSLNPKRLIEDRQADEARLDRIRVRVDDVNRRLASPQSRRKDSSALAEIDRLVRRLSLGNVCSTNMEKTEDSRRVVLHVDAAAWRRRRRSDGIALVITHPEVPGSAPDRVTRYFSKDAIEKDFQTIKSALGLRPVRHRTDPKLRAHVSVCMLALLLTRLIEHRLVQVGTRRTLPAIIERLEPVRLNLIDDDNNRYYAATQPAEDVTELLHVLGMLDLVDNSAITKEITPR